MKPNILVIMTDQQRADTIHGWGNPYIHTPNLDRLSAEGVSFTNAYSTTPVCLPARQNLLTGLFSHTLGIMNNGEYMHNYSTLPECLNKAGYFTQAIGKMHFKPVRNHHGFQKMLLSEEIPKYKQDDEYLMFLHKQGYSHVEEPHGRRHEYLYQPQVSELPEELQTTTWTADRTVEFIEQNRNRPFFCFTSFIKPHPPWDPPKPYDQMYDKEILPLPVRCDGDKEPLDYSITEQNYKTSTDHLDDDALKKIKASYYGSISLIDKNIGKILDALEKHNLRKNTILFFVSDHGEMLGDHYAWSKSLFYEGAAKIPFIISWPGHFPEGENRTQLVSLLDIMPTILPFAEADLPEGLAGKDLTHCIVNKDYDLRDELIGEIGRGLKTKFMLRWGQWKYIYIANGAREQLFNLEHDPNELDNLAGQNEELCRRAYRRIVDFYRKEPYTQALCGDQLISFPFTAYQLGSRNAQYAIWPGNDPDRQA